MAIYDISYLGTTANRITFNDFSGGTPIFRTISRAPQRREIRELDIPVPFENGISDFETLTGKYAYVIEGIMYAGNESEYDTGLESLRKTASLENAQNDNLSDSGYVPYIWSEFTSNKQIFVKILYVDIKQQTNQGFVQPFRLICKVKDPTIYSETTTLASTLAGSFSTASGSATYPFQYPILYGASTSTVSTDANNTGDLPVYPLAITVYGPVNLPRVTNLTTGEYIEVSVNLTDSSKILSIVYDKDTLSVTNNGVNALSSVSSTSTFFKIQPGSNSIQLSGSSISGDSYATLSYYSGWSLS